MELFNRKVVRKIIEFKWPLAREYTIKKQLIPFLIFQLTYLVYVNEFYNVRNDSQEMLNVNYGLMGALALFSLYFLALEAVQLVEEKCNYFTSIWNYLDIIPPILILVFLPLVLVGTFDGQNAELEATIQATMSLIIWLKLLYFLRIFENTGYLIRIITEVVASMKYFLFILLIAIVAFADAIRQFSTSNKEDA
jgi:hypothetical protein